MTSPERQTLSALLKKYNLRPGKNLGQNFLTDPGILDQIVKAADVNSQDTVLEIGAGLGHLTSRLAFSARQVVAVELDKRLISALEDNLKPFSNIRIVQGDILKLDPSDLVSEDNYLVVANIPYYITSSIIRNLLESGVKPKRIILTIQYEVAQRITAISGQMSVLALSVLMYGEPILLKRIPADAFYPSPKVDSAVLRIDLYPEPILPAEQRETYFKLVKAGFLHKRKTLRNSLSTGLKLPPGKIESLLSAAEIDPQRRAQTLSLPEWLELTNQYDKIKKIKTNNQNSH
jgi:16S rRNA (adenine1518-N6/adenine1519-N6)-dimethyltransferase